ncbi:HSP18 transcriptional regulator [Amycolatopsis bartoniae]|nr:HSP18 transcriptional regulator [Amycolatopsis bartoniae]
MPVAAEAVALVQTAVGSSTEPAELLAALTVLRGLRDELAEWEPRLIGAAREQGVSWARLAPALGVTSRQAAERRYLRLRPSAEHRTGEQRVEAERSRRAGERAVAAWARQNSGSLRRLAGQIGALEGLDERAQDRVQEALADDDAASLLSPLAEAHAALEGRHVGLAEQVRSITERAQQVRRDTQQQRVGDGAG